MQHDVRCQVIQPRVTRSHLLCPKSFLKRRISALLCGIRSSMLQLSQSGLFLHHHQCMQAHWGSCLTHLPACQLVHEQNHTNLDKLQGGWNDAFPQMWCWYIGSQRPICCSLQQEAAMLVLPVRSGVIHSSTVCVSFSTSNLYVILVHESGSADFFCCLVSASWLHEHLLWLISSKSQATSV